MFFSLWFTVKIKTNNKGNVVKEEWFPVSKNAVSNRVSVSKYSNRKAFQTRKMQQVTLHIIVHVNKKQSTEII